MIQLEKPATGKDKLTVAKDRLTLLETRLAHEFNLAGHRMSWLVTSQAFLFTAWVQLSRVAEQSLPRTSFERSRMDLLFTLIPCIGIITAIAGGVATWAAMRMTDYLVTDRADFDGDLGLRDMSPLRESSWTRWIGQMPPGILPASFVIAWLTIVARDQRQFSSIPSDALLFDSACLWIIWCMWWVIRLLARRQEVERTTWIKLALISTRAGTALPAYLRWCRPPRGDL